MNSNNNDNAIDLLLEERFKKLKASTGQNNDNNNKLNDKELEERAKSLGVYVSSSQNTPIQLEHTKDDEDMVDEILDGVRDELRLEGHNPNDIPIRVVQGNDDNIDDLDEKFLSDLVNPKSLKNDYKQLKKELKNEKINLKELKPNDISKMKNDLDQLENDEENEDKLADDLLAKLMAEDN